MSKPNEPQLSSPNNNKMSTIILNVLNKVPVPIFGTASYAVQFAVRKSNLLPRLAPWGVPFGAGALWFVWPAVDEEWKGEMGLVAPAVVETVKIEEPVYRMSAMERKVVEAMKGGDYSYLENDWEAFQKKASNPNEDDDDDEDEDDEDGDEDGDDGDDDDGDDDGGDDLAAAADEDDDEEDDGEDDAVAEAAKAARISAEEERVLDNIRKGDFSSLEADWDAFQIKASNPNEDDDDDDEDEDEDGDDEEEEEGGEEEGDDEEEE